MEGAMFYWICWLLWIYVTFFMDKKNNFRFRLSVIILVVINLADQHFTLGRFEIYSGGICLLILSYILFSQEKGRAIFYYFICSYIITMAYVTFHLFEIFDPIWIIFKKEWMMGICFGYLAVLLQKTLKCRLLIIICGTMQGELLYAYILSKFELPYSIGALAYLDVCSLTVILLVIWSFLENGGSILQQYFHFFEKGKQKSS